MPSSLTICDRSDLEGMHTGSLLARLRRLQQCEESFEHSDRSGTEMEPDPSETGRIEFKNTSVWRAAYRDVKEILDTREHLPTAAEREARRKSKGL